MTYEEKFSRFIKTCNKAKNDVVAEAIIVDYPEALGDTHEELIESLNHLSDAGLALRILPRKERKN